MGDSCCVLRGASSSRDVVSKLSKVVRLDPEPGTRNPKLFACAWAGEQLLQASMASARKATVDQDNVKWILYFFFMQDGVNHGSRRAGRMNTDLTVCDWSAGGPRPQHIRLL